MGKRLITILLVLLTIGVQVFAQSAVSGKVTDKTGEPLVGAGVLVKGTTSGTTTDLDGKFSLQGLKQNAVLAFSSIGYETQEVTVGNQTVINVTLNEEAEFLNDVVVVAYGTAKKRDLTGAMSSIKGDNIKAQSVSSVSRALEGAAPGIQLSSVDGQPGVDMAIRVRGASSTSDGSAVALVVIDGVPLRHPTLFPPSTLPTLKASRCSRTQPQPHFTVHEVPTVSSLSTPRKAAKARPR